MKDLFGNGIDVKFPIILGWTIHNCPSDKVHSSKRISIKSTNGLSLSNQNILLPQQASKIGLPFEILSVRICAAFGAAVIRYNYSIKKPNHESLFVPTLAAAVEPVKLQNGVIMLWFYLVNPEPIGHEIRARVGVLDPGIFADFIEIAVNHSIYKGLVHIGEGGRPP